MNRWKAALVHLSLSALCFGLPVLGIFWFWYGGALFHAAGGNQLAKIIIGVDVVIGPLLTLIIYNPRKKELRRDLAIIACLQIVAFVYGATTLLAARPAYIAFVKDRFELVPANQVFPGDMGEKDPSFFTAFDSSVVPLGRAKIVGTRSLSSPAEREKLVVANVAGVDLQQFPKYHVPYVDRAKEAATAGRPFKDLHDFYSKDGKVVELPSGETEASTKFLPLMGRKRDMTVLIEEKTGRFIGIIDVDPWVRSPQ